MGKKIRIRIRVTPIGIRSVDDLDPNKDFVIIWDSSKLTYTEKQKTRSLLDFASAGDRIVVLSTYSWDWQDLCNLSIVRSGPFSRVFTYDNVYHPMLKGIDNEWLKRWNGLPGTVAVAEIKVLDNAKFILWASKPSCTVVAEVPVNSGRGKILFSQLDIQSHIDSSKSNYDPVAERILLNLLGQ